MALVPRSSLRSLVLLMSHGKPQLSSFFSSAAATRGAGAGADTPPAAPVTPAPSDRPCPNPKLPQGPRANLLLETVNHPLPGGPRRRPRPPPRQSRGFRDLAGEADPNAPEDPATYHTPDHGSCSSTPEPVSDEPPCGTSEDGKQQDVDLPPLTREDVGHPVLGPPRPTRPTRSPVTDEPAQCAEEHPRFPVPDDSSCAVPPPAPPGDCTPAAPDVQPPVNPALPDCSSRKPPQHEEGVFHPIPGGPSPPPRPPRRGAVEDVANEACLNAPEDPAYPTPDHGSSSTSEGESGSLLEDPRHPVLGPPGRP